MVMVVMVMVVGTSWYGDNDGVKSSNGDGMVKIMMGVVVTAVERIGGDGMTVW